MAISTIWKHAALPMLVLLYLSDQADSQSCSLIKGSTCSCVMSDGSGIIDLSPISSSNGQPFFKSIKGNAHSKFSYNPCQSFTDEKFANCKGEIAVCQETLGGLSCGVQGSALFVFISANPLVMNLTYQHGDGDRQSFITLNCDPNVEGDLQFLGEDPSLHYNFKLTTKYACPIKRHQPEKNVVSVGTILCIALIAVVLIYLLVGMLFMKFRREAAGCEVIPNKEFWTSFPGLIKAGLFFTLSPCRKKPGKGDSYESIK